MRVTLLALTLLAAPAVAQDPITPDTFLDAAEGKTLTFTNLNSGNMAGIEEFLNRDQSLWLDAGGDCKTGHVYVEDDLVCFHYEGDPYSPHCWWPFIEDGQLMVMSNSTLGVQVVTDITERPVECSNVPLS